MKEDTKVTEDLRRTLAWTDLVLATIGEGICVVDSAGQIIFVNDSFGKIIKFERIALLQKKVTDILQFKQDVEEGPHTLTIDGKPIVLDIKVSKVPNHEQSVIVVRNITLDVEKDIQLEEKMEELERMNKLFVGRELKMATLKKELERCKG